VHNLSPFSRILGATLYTHLKTPKITNAAFTIENQGKLRTLVSMCTYFARFSALSTSLRHFLPRLQCTQLHIATSLWGFWSSMS